MFEENSRIFLGFLADLKNFQDIQVFQVIHLNFELFGLKFQVKFKKYCGEKSVGVKRNMVGKYFEWFLAKLTFFIKICEI